MLFSKSTIAFYLPEIHGTNIPADVVEITDEEHSALLAGQAEGKRIVSNASGHPILQDQPPLTYEQIQAQMISLVQEHMDSAARMLNYDSIATAITYAEEPAVPKFQAEGLAFRAWRSFVWAKCYEILAEVQAGEREMPSGDELIAELPPASFIS